MTAEWMQGDTRTILLQGVIPLVLGIGLCLLGCMYLFGVLRFCKRHDDQVAPMMTTVSADSASPEEMTLEAAENAFGPVACQAQLLGMKPKERQAVLEKIFSNCQKYKDWKTSGVDNDQSERQEDDVFHSTHTAVDIRFACAICLREYEDEDQVMTGTNCDHKFHKTCALLWLTHYTKPKDHCPYCREIMLSPVEMKAAATEVLGDCRVQELAQYPRIHNNDNTTTATLSQSQDSLDNNNIITVPDIEEGTA